MSQEAKDMIGIGLWIVFGIIGVISTISFIARHLAPAVCSWW